MFWGQCWIGHSTAKQTAWSPWSRPSVQSSPPPWLSVCPSAPGRAWCWNQTLIRTDLLPPLSHHCLFLPLFTVLWWCRCLLLFRLALALVHYQTRTPHLWPLILLLEASTLHACPLFWLLWVMLTHRCHTPNRFGTVNMEDNINIKWSWCEGWAWRSLIVAIYRTRRLSWCKRRLPMLTVITRTRTAKKQKKLKE